MDCGQRTCNCDGLSGQAGKLLHFGIVVNGLDIWSRVRSPHPAASLFVKFLGQSREGQTCREGGMAKLSAIGATQRGSSKQCLTNVI